MTEIKTGNDAIIYISGPVTGLDPAIVERNFFDAEKYLETMYPLARLVNPVRIAKELPPLTHDQCMQVCFGAMSVCTHMYQLPGWRNSRGCNQEAGYAFARHIEILPPETKEDDDET